MMVQGKLMSKAMLEWSTTASDKSALRRQHKQLTGRLSLCKLAAAMGAWAAHAEEKRTDKAIVAVCQRSGNF